MPTKTATDVQRWFTDRIPEDWFEGGVAVEVDQDEILVVGSLAGAAEEAPDASRAFRESTRKARIEIAQDAEQLFGRKVSWAVNEGDRFIPFTGLGVPVMTRLRLRERALLDTLVASGVARSRSEALSWCARLVASKQKEWIAELQEAFAEVEKVRAKGPDA